MQTFKAEPPKKTFNDNFIVGRCISSNEETGEVLIETDMGTLEKLYKRKPELFKNATIMGHKAEEIFK